MHIKFKIYVKQNVAVFIYSPSYINICNRGMKWFWYMKQNLAISYY
jgi:hypothetical protein